MPKGNQDERGVPVAVAAIARALHELIDFGRRQIFARPQLGIRRPGRN